MNKLAKIAETAAMTTPNGEAVAALIDRASRLSEAEAERLAAAWDRSGVAAEAAAWDFAVTAAQDAARASDRVSAWNAVGVTVRGGGPARYAARYAARDAVRAVVVRDLITPEQYAILTGPWAAVIGPAHPDDTQATQ